MTKFFSVVVIAAALVFSPLSWAQEASEAKPTHECPHKVEGQPCPMHTKLEGKHADAKSCPKHKGKHHGAHHSAKANGEAKACDCVNKHKHEGQHGEAKACKHKAKHAAHHGEHKGHHGAHHAKVDTHNCPMHSRVTGIAGDECPKCGMKLEPMAKGSDTHYCPMNPKIMGKAGDSCPKCGMKLEPKKDLKETMASKGHHKHH